MRKRETHVKSDPVFHIIIDNCFGSKLSEKFFEHIISLKKNFSDGTISNNVIAKRIRNNLACNIDSLYTNNTNTTESHYWKNLKKIRKKSILLKHIDKFMESEFTRSLMDSAPFPLCKFREFNQWSTQISRYGNGGHYQWHIDRINSDKRTVSIVYYCYKEPKKFSGGELLLTNASCFDGKLISVGNSVQIEPKNDRMVIFNSRTTHRVNPTKSPQKFEDGRFSIAIWTGLINPPLKSTW